MNATAIEGFALGHTCNRETWRSNAHDRDRDNAAEFLRWSDEQNPHDQISKSRLRRCRREEDRSFSPQRARDGEDVRLQWCKCANGNLRENRERSIARLMLSKDESSYGDGAEEAFPILRVGNLSVDTLDVNLLSMFAKHRVLECMMTFSARNSALVYFKRMADAKTAKEVFQGSVVFVNSIRIKYARLELPLWRLAGSVNDRRYDARHKYPLVREGGDCQVCLDQKCGHHERGYSVSKPPIARKAERHTALPVKRQLPPCHSPKRPWEPPLPWTRPSSQPWRSSPQRSVQTLPDMLSRGRWMQSLRPILPRWAHPGSPWWSPPRRPAPSRRVSLLRPPRGGPAETLPRDCHTGAGRTPPAYSNTRMPLSPPVLQRVPLPSLAAHASTMLRW